ncbi:MAG: CinA family nicotinamide mononucleotide deamidase-related protein [Desulfobulbus sp.]|jgi:nicotinamide-nucleotide amidase
MIGEIIAIGDELISGRIANTTSSPAARKLFMHGQTIRRIHTIGDDPEQITRVLNEAIARSEFILTTGGLGITTDDLTIAAIAKALGLPLRPHPELVACLQARMAREPELLNGLPLDRMALLPEGAEPLDPECRMAGYRLCHQGVLIYLLPGIPSQMEQLLREQVLPGLRAACGNRPAPPVMQRLYRTCGLFEHEINQRLAALEQPPVQIGYYPVGAEVHVVLTMSGLENGAADSLFQATDVAIREALGEALYGLDNETLASVTGRLLSEQGYMLGVAESCTAGLIGATITEVPGSSRWFKGGLIVYANEAKERLLGIDPALLARHGAVSAETARAMAEQTARRLGCDIAVAATGIAGPGGGSAEKPVGTVYLGLWDRGRLSHHLCRFDGGRRPIQEQTAQTALNLVRLALVRHTGHDPRRLHGSKQ